MCRFACFVVLFHLGFVVIVDCKTDFKYVDYIGLKQFEEFKDSPEIRVAYFYKREVSRLQPFYRGYERSAELLRAYNVRCAVVDCTSTPGEEFCGTKRAEYYVFAYRDGYELLQLELESMFDVNSIMSNILQLVLLRDVPIVQTMTEMHDLEDSVKGQHDLIFAYHRAIGTYEHRVFMDVAYAYQSKYKFAVTTEKTTVSFLPGVDEDSDAYCKIWVFNCKDTTLTTGVKRSHCPAFRYSGKIDMVELASFVIALGLPSVFHMPDDGKRSPYRDVSIHTLTLYHNNKGRNVVYDYANHLTATYRGMLGIITVNVDSDVPEEFQYAGSLPAAILQLKNSNDTRSMSGEMDEAILSNFVRDGLADFQKGVRSGGSTDEAQLRDESVEIYTERMEDIEREVNNEDDQVARALRELRRFPVNLTHIPALTDKTFPLTLRKKDLAVVLFYIQVDAPSHAFLHTYAELGATFSPADSPLVRVECFDWTDVCEQENITSYPTIYIYHRGQKPRQYNGHLDQTALLSAIKLHQLDGLVKLTDQAEVEQFAEGRFPEAVSQASNVSVLGLISDTNGIDEFIKASKQFVDSIPFGLVSDPGLIQEIASQREVTPPVVLIHNREDALRPVNVYKWEINAAFLSRYINTARIPLFGEITARNFPLIHSQLKPLLVVFVGTSSTGVIETMSKVALDYEFSWAIFCWMDVSGLNSLGSKILYEYTKQSKVPHLSLVFRQKSEVYNFPGPDIVADTVRQWLRSIKKEKISPSINLPRGAWHPKHEGYDFLRMMDEGLVDRSDDDIGLDNEMGVGFDEEGNYNHEISEEGVKLSESVDEVYRDSHAGSSSDEEVEDLEHSRLASPHKKSTARGDKSTVTTTKEPVTHDAGEF